jgi:hypothetical protein
MAGPGETKINNTSYRECPLTKNGLSENHFSGSPSSLGSKKTEEVFIPYTVQGVIGDIRARLKVLAENYDEKGVRLTVRAKAEDFDKIRKKIKDILADL